MTATLKDIIATFNNNSRNLEIVNQAFANKILFAQNLSMSVFWDLKFLKINFSGSYFTDCKFENCTFEKTEMRKYEFKDCMFKSCNLINSNFSIVKFDNNLFIDSQFYRVDF